MDRTSSLPPRLMARLAGLCYLVSIGVGAFDHIVVGRGLIAPDDAAATAHNIMASETLYRLAFAVDLVPTYLIVTLLFYQLFRPVNRSLSLLAAFASLMGGAVGSAIGVFQLAPVAILGGGPLFVAFNAAQLDDLSLMSLKLHELGFNISLVFFGFYCLLIGWLIVRSRLMPALVGVLLALGGVAYMAHSFAEFVDPALGARVAGYALGLGSLGEAVLTVWLLAVGVNASRWREWASAA